MSVPNVVPTAVPTIITPEDLLAIWAAELESDFAQDGKPATFAPGHPAEWGNETARIDLPTPGKGHSRCIAVNDAGRLLAVSVGPDIRIYDTTSLELLRTLLGVHPHSVSSIQFQPGHGMTGKILVGGMSTRGDSGNFRTNVIRCWDLGEPAELAVTPEALAEAAKAATSAAAGSLRGRGAIDSWSDDKVQNGIFDTLSWYPVKLGLPSGHTCEGTLTKGKVFSSDGSFFLYVTGFTLVIVDCKSLQTRHTLVGHTKMITWADTTPDQKIIGTSSWDKTTRLWSASTGEQLRVLTGGTSQSWVGAFSPDGSLVCTTSGHCQIRVWSVENGELVHTLGGFTWWVRNLAFSPDGTHLAAGSRGILRVFDVSTGESTQCWQLQESSVSRILEVHSVLYTLRGLLLFEIGDRVFTYDTKTNQKGHYKHPDGITPLSGSGDMVVTPDARTLINADLDGNVRLWALA